MAGWVYAAESNEPNYADWSKTDSQFKPMEDDTSIISRLLGSIVIILVLGTAAYYMTKKMGFKVRPISGRYIEIVESVSIGSGKQLHLIRSCGKDILVSSTANEIRKISENQSRDTDITNA